MSDELGPLGNPVESNRATLQLIAEYLNAKHLQAPERFSSPHPEVDYTVPVVPNAQNNSLTFYTTAAAGEEFRTKIVPLINKQGIFVKVTSPDAVESLDNLNGRSNSGFTERKIEIDGADTAALFMGLSQAIIHLTPYEDKNAGIPGGAVDKYAGSGGRGQTQRQ